jgi:hypothetical protein
MSESTCKHCGALLKKTMGRCWLCGGDLSGPLLSPPPRPNRHSAEEESQGSASLLLGVLFAVLIFGAFMTFGGGVGFLLVVLLTPIFLGTVSKDSGGIWFFKQLGLLAGILVSVVFGGLALAFIVCLGLGLLRF